MYNATTVFTWWLYYHDAMIVVISNKIKKTKT